MIVNKTKGRVIGITLTGRVQNGRGWERRYFAVMQGQRQIVVLRPDYTIAECIAISDPIHLTSENLEWAAFLIAQIARAWWEPYRIPAKETKAQ